MWDLTITLLAIVVVVSLSSLQNTVAFRVFPSPNPFRCQSPPLSPPSPLYNPLLPPLSPPLSPPKHSATAAPPPPVPALPPPLPPPLPPRRGPDFKVDSPPPFPFPPCKRLLRSTVAAAATVSVLQPPPSDQPSTTLPSPTLPPPLPPPPRRGPDFKVDAPPFGVDSPPYCRRRSDDDYGIHPGPQQYDQDCTDVYDFQPPPPSTPHYGYGRRCSGDDDGPDIHPGPHA